MPGLRHIARAPELVTAARRTPAVLPLLSRYLGIERGPYPLTVPLRTGGSLTLSSQSEVAVFWQIFVHASYGLPQRCDTILDVGANVGIFSVWAAIQRPQARIIALEPFPETFRALETNIARNRLEQRVRCVRLAVAGTSGERAMGLGGESPTRRIVTPEHPQALPGTVTVPCVQLAECMEAFDLDTLDLLKMDIEGSEWEVLFATPLPVLARIRHIQLEYHEVHRRFGYTPEKLIAYLALAGHQLVSRVEDQHHTGVARFTSLPL